MVDIEDLKIYFFDSFLNSDQFESLTSGDAYYNHAPTDLLLNAGTVENSYIRLNYIGNNYNPLYSEIVFKLNLSSKDNIFAFWGFKKTLDAPTENMTESHAGFMIINNKVYLTTADGDNQQKVEIVTIDITKVYEYMIKFNQFSYKPLPQVEIYLGMPSISRVARVWKLLQTNSTYPPENEVHYIMMYLQNKTIIQKTLNINRIIYKEEYAD